MYTEAISLFSYKLLLGIKKVHSFLTSNHEINGQNILNNNNYKL